MVHVFFFVDPFRFGFLFLRVPRWNFASGRNICRSKVWVIPGIHSFFKKKTSDDQEFGIAAGWNSMRNPHVLEEAKQKFMANQPTPP